MQYLDLSSVLLVRRYPREESYLILVFLSNPCGFEHPMAESGLANSLEWLTDLRLRRDDPGGESSCTTSESSMLHELNCLWLREVSGEGLASAMPVNCTRAHPHFLPCVILRLAIGNCDWVKDYFHRSFSDKRRDEGWKAF